MASRQPKRLRDNTIDAFFKSARKEPGQPTPSNVEDFSLSNEGEHVEPSIAGIDANQEFNSSSLERDLGKRPPMWTYPINQQDEIRRAYIKLGPYQLYLPEYPYSSNEKYHRRFRYSWFSQFPSWLEYSPTKDAAYCLPCYLFASKPNPRFGSNAFTIEGFRNWKKVNCGKDCAFLRHMGDHTSPHYASLKSCDEVMNQSRHIDKVMQRQSAEQILNNHLRLKTSIDCVRWLAYQSCPFRGHDEGPTSKNPGNFLEMVKLLASYNDKVAGTILEKAPPNAKYISPHILLG